jgi:Tol biopolymer transport system component
MVNRIWLYLSVWIAFSMAWSPAWGADFHVDKIRRIARSSGEMQNQKENYIQPSWSSNADFLAFEVLAEKKRQLYLYQYSEEASTFCPPILSGNSSRRRAAANFDITWSNISDLFVYVGSGSQGSFGLYYTNPEKIRNGNFWLIEGGEKGDPFVAFPDFHPDADYLVYSQGITPLDFGSFSQEEARLDLFTLKVQPKDKTPKTEGQAQGSLLSSDFKKKDIPQLEPSFSPSGNEVVFTGIDRGNYDIYKMTVLPTIDYQSGSIGGFNIVTDGVKRLTDMPTPEGQPCWSPDGSMIAFLSGKEQQKNEWGLWVMDADGTNQHKLVDRVLNQDFPEWHPTSRQIFFVKVWEEEMNPIQYVDVRTGKIGTLETGTALHTHLDISQDGRKIAFCAKGRMTDRNLTWLKLYTAGLVSR